MPKKLDKAMIEKDSFVSSIMVGDCPKCGSPNTHDCTAVTFEYDFEGEIEKMGSDCEVAKKLDDPTIGHCDDCDYLWCIECGTKLSIDQPECDHFKICEQCGRSYETPSMCPHFEEEQAGNLIVNPCLLGCPRIETCSKCPYCGQTEDCPKVKKEISAALSGEGN